MLEKQTKLIANLDDLCNHFWADSPAQLNRRLHKDTSCGASISLLLANGEWLHNGQKLSRRFWNGVEFEDHADNWEDVKNEDVVGFTIQTIVEGSDATVDSGVFTFPCSGNVVDKWIETMEEQASELWDEANGDEETREMELLICEILQKLGVVAGVRSDGDDGDFCAPAVHIGEVAYGPNPAYPVVSVVRVQFERKAITGPVQVEGWQVYRYKPYQHYGCTLVDAVEHGEPEQCSRIAAREAILAYCHELVNASFGWGFGV